MRFLRTSLSACLLAGSLSSAFGQSAPLFTLGQVPTPAQWHSYFAGKQDALGFAPLPATGGTLSGRLVIAPPAGVAGINVAPSAAAPTSPANGDIWVTPNGLYAQVGGQAHNISSPVPGSQTTYPLVGNGFSTVFQLPVSVDVTHTSVTIGGLIQAPGSSYAIAGQTLTFAAAPPSGALIIVAVGPLTTVPQVEGSSLVQQTFPFTGDGSTMTFGFSAQAETTDRYTVTIGGVVQSRSSCTISTNALTCVAPPPAGTDIEVVVGP